MDKVFYIFLNNIKRNDIIESNLGVDAIIALYKIKNLQSDNIDPNTLNWLKENKIIKRSRGNALKYVLSDEYKQLKENELKIGTRYIEQEVGQLVAALQGNTLKIGELEQKLSGSLNRNKIKYLINKLFQDQIIIAEGSGKGTRYKLEHKFSALQNDELIHTVITYLRQSEGL